MASNPSFLENRLAPALSLNGDWWFQLAGHAPISLPVPSAWEAHLPDKVTDGPALYRRSFDLPVEWFQGQRVLFEAQAISFAANVRVNGAAAGEHEGLWSPFQLDVTELVHPGENQIEIEVWKPGRRFPLREALAGFLGDVCTTFGGVWQDVGLRAFRAAIEGLRVLNERGGRLRVQGRVAGVRDGWVRVEVTDEAGTLMAAAEQQADGEFDLTLDLGGGRRWHPAQPTLYTATMLLMQEGACLARAERRVGLRDVHAADGQAWLDGRPLHLRGVLDWGWNADLLRPAPGRAGLAQQFAQMRSLGFNLIKLCLFVPDEATFEAADEAGVYLWLEMPLWLPKVTPAVRALALREYEAVFRRVHHHPSIVVLSLGCELNAESDASFLEALTALARAYFPNVLHVDNSGSAEAYGGVATALSDFYDYHFYTDPHFFTALVEHFDRRYRTARPWLFGEFCDADTCRDFSALQPEPWWLHEPLTLDRDDLLSMRAYRERLAAAGISDGAASLVAVAREQATAIRKNILEQTRTHSATGGYVISGWADTPITTAGIVDDLGRLKFAPETWRQFNADAILLLDRERRRRWVGGDRPAYRDPFTWRAGERLELHVLLSNRLGDFDGGRLRWRLDQAEGSALLTQGEVAVGGLRAGTVQELAVIAERAPELAPDRPHELRLSVELALSARGAEAPLRNEWRLWVVPQTTFPPVVEVEPALLGQLNLERVDRNVRLAAPVAASENPLLAGTLSEALLARVARGGQAVLWLREPVAGSTRALPFWREAIHVFEPHALWQRVPHAGYADMRFFSVASDLALDLAGLQAALGPDAKLRPVWRRFDARSLYWAEYLVAVQYGLGRLWVTSLGLRGGLGRQPDGFDTNPMGAWLLAQLLRPA
jgi:hypothetical protein